MMIWVRLDVLKKCLEKTFSNNFKSVLKGKVDGLKNKYIEIFGISGP